VCVLVSVLVYSLLLAAAQPGEQGKGREGGIQWSGQQAIGNRQFEECDTRSIHTS